MKTTEITAGELFTTGKATDFAPDALFILDTATSIAFSIEPGSNLGKLKKAEKGEPKRMLAILSNTEPARIREHLEELRKLTIEDLLGETQFSEKLPKGTFMRGITPASIKATYAEIEETRAAAKAEKEAEEAAALAARNGEYEKARDLDTMIRLAGIPTTGPNRITFDFAGHATLTTETLKELLIAATRANR